MVGDVMNKGAFELVFVGGISKRYKRHHATYEEAADTAYRVLLTLENRAAHPAIIYGPGLGKDGHTIP